MRRVVPLLALLLVPACGDSGSGSAATPFGTWNVGPPFAAGREAEALFVAEKSAPGTQEVFVVSQDGATIRSISGPAVAGAAGGAIAWSPGGSRVLFELEMDVDGVMEVFTSVSTGGPPTRLHPPLPPGRKAGFAFWAPDGSRVAYISNQADPSRDQVWVSPAASEVGNVQASAVAGAAALVREPIKWAPSGDRLLYRTSSGMPQTFDLYAAVADGSGVVELSEAAAAPGRGVAGEWSPDGSRVACLARESGSGFSSVFIIDPDGSDRVPVSTLGGSLLEWSPNGRRLAFAHDDGLWTCLADGSGLVKVSGSLGAFLAGVMWAPDGSRVAYLDGGELWSAPSAVAGQSLLHSGSIEVSDFAWSADSSRIAYAGQRAGSPPGLFVTPGTAAGALQIAPDTQAGTKNSPRWSPDGLRVAYRALDSGPPVRHEAHVALADGSGSVRVSPDPGISGISVSGVGWTRDGSRVLLRRDPEVFLPSGLYAAFPNGSPALLISGATVGSGVVTAVIRKP